MDGFHILILLCGLIIFSYLFDLVAKRTRLPAVLLLLGLGMGLRALADASHLNVFDMNRILPTIGTVGLILIVFEGALELTYDRSKNAMIRKAFLAALFILLFTTGAIAYIIHATTGAAVLTCVANAIPLSVISSAVAIPSASGLQASQREFVVYESSFSDILGIIFFNFAVTNSSFGAQAFGWLGVDIIGVLALSAVFSMALLWLLGRIKHKVKFFLILAIMVLVYALGKQFHLSSLVVVLAFGMFLANADKVPSVWFRKHFIHTEFHRDLDQFHSLSRETAFLIRTFFFVLFGFSVVVGQLADINAASLAGGLLAATYLVRAVFLRVAVRMDLSPLVYITPRGLISILLYFSLPPALRIPEVGIGLLFMMVLATCLLMAIGLLISGKPPKPQLLDIELERKPL